jgi:hypothetical protein
MAATFPISPVNGQTATVNNIVYQYSSATDSWTRLLNSVSALANGTSNVVVYSSGNVAVGVNGSSNVAVFTTSGVEVLGTVSATSNISAANINTVGLWLSGNVLSAINSTSNITTTGNITSNYYFGNGSQLTGIITSVANINNGNSNISIDSPAANITVAVSGVANVVVFTPTGLAVSGNVSATGGVSATGNVTANYVIGNGSALTSLNGSNVTGQVANALIAGTVYDNAQPNITSVGILTSLSSTGNITGANIIGNGAALTSLSGFAVVGNVGNAVHAYFADEANSVAGGNVSGQVANALIAGTVYTNAQPNITSVGILSNVSVTGNVIGGNVNAVSNITANNAVFVTAAYANAQVTDRNQLATKFYVDNSVAAGINIHDPVVAATTGNLVATYAPGGTTPTWTDIVNGNTLVTGSAHGLVTNDQITFYVTTNGITANQAYFVFDTPNATAITISDIWVGTQITTLTNGTGLSITSRAKPGVGATLTNADTQAALTSDGVTLGVSDRFLVKDQANAAQNGIYVVTSTGNVSTDWVLTRSSDTNQFAPQSPQGLSAGDYVYVSGGNTQDGTSYVQTTNAYIIIGTTNLAYTQFSGTVTYTGNSPVTVTGQTIGLANVTGTGNTVVLQNTPSLITPNIGDASGTTVSVTANVTGGNIVTSGIVSASGNVTGGNVITSGAISATSLSASGNVTALNVNTNAVVGTGTAIQSTGNIALSATGNITVNNTYITGIQLNPVQDQDVASKYYVDNLVSTAISYHEAVLAATTANLATTTGGTITYTQPNGAGNGVGALLTTTGSFDLIDTANVQTLGTRILVKNEGNAVYNGVYTWANATNIVRSTDTNTAGLGNTAALGLNDYFFVQGGNINKGAAWVVNAPSGVINFGTSNITFSEFSSSQTYTANTAAGILLNGTVINAKVDENTTAFDGTGNIIVKASANLTTPNIGAATGNSLSVTGNITAGNLIQGTTRVYKWTTSETAPSDAVPGDDWFIASTGKLYQYWNDGTGNFWVDQSQSNSFDSIAVSGNAVITGNVTSGNIFTDGLISAAANVTGGNIFTGGRISATGNITSAGNITGGNILGGANVNATTHTGTTVSVTGNITGGNVSTAGLITATGNVTGGNIITLGSVAIGLASAGVALDVKGVARSSIGTGTGAGGAGYAFYQFGTSATTTENWHIGSEGDGSFRFYQQSLGSGLERVRIDSTSVGFSVDITNRQANGVGNIGNSTTYFNTVFAKATSAQYADLAELYAADQNYDYGTVVVFGGAKEITTSDRSHDTAVAGVVSQEPAFIMNSGLTAEWSVPVALTGRVQCRVQGPVRKGDVLVNISAGVAGKLDPKLAQWGSVLGKSLEDLPDHTIKLIEVVVGRY